MNFKWLWRAQHVSVVPLDGAATSVQSCSQSHIKEKLELITHTCPSPAAALGNSQPEEDLSENTCCLSSHWELHRSRSFLRYFFLPDAEIRCLYRSSGSLCICDSNKVICFHPPLFILSPFWSLNLFVLFRFFFFSCSFRLSGSSGTHDDDCAKTKRRKCIKCLKYDVRPLGWYSWRYPGGRVLMLDRVLWSNIARKTRRNSIPLRFKCEIQYIIFPFFFLSWHHANTDMNSRDSSSVRALKPEFLWESI